MIVYHEQHRRVRTTTLLANARASAAALSPQPDHGRAVDALLDVGALEAAVADARCPEVDSVDELSGVLRGACVAAGHLLWHARRGTWGDAGRWRDRLGQALERVRGLPLPAEVDVSAPEGFAHYAVYPDAYLEAVRRHAGAIGGRAVACIGIRGIGATLAGAAAAACEELGCEVVTFTVRPRGHPFDRRLALAPALAARLSAVPERTVMLVDEGPGLSGSSFAGAAQALNDLGIADERIVFLPSRRADGSALCSAAARARWHRHRQWVVDFEAIRPTAGMRDLSAGRWRRLAYTDERAYPAVHPRHERRKYLDGRGRLLRFAGLGRYGRAKLVRAEELAAAAWGPRPLELDGGFLAYDWIDGRQVAPETADAALLDAAAGYLAHVARAFPAELSGADARGARQAVGEMIEANIAEGLGARYAAEWRRRTRPNADVPTERPTALDGRMLPHEWLRTADGPIKTDALDHHDDHFFPGRADIAWDVAGWCAELGLGAADRAAFVARYRRASGDRTIASRVPYYTVAYLAFRLGYAAHGAATLPHTPDGERFARAAARYGARLRAELACDSATSV